MKFVTLRYERSKAKIYLKTANDRMMYKFKLCSYIRVIVSLEILNWEIDDWLNQEP